MKLELIAVGCWLFAFSGQLVEGIGQTADGVHVGAPKDPSEQLTHHKNHFIPLKGDDHKVKNIDNFDDYIKSKTTVVEGATYEQQLK